MDTNVLEILNQLIVFDRQMSIYPKGHGMVEQACQKLMSSLDIFFVGSESLELVVVKPSISVNGVEATLSPVRRDALLDMFSKRGLLSVTLFRGVSKSQVIELFSCLQSVPQRSHILYHQDIIKAISEIGNISVRYMQLGGVQYTENLASDPGLPAESKKVLEYLLFGSGSRQQPTDPAGIAAALSDNREHVLEGYVNLLNEAVHGTHSQASQDKQAFFRAVRDLLPKMPSELRGDFLTITYDQLSEEVTDEQLESVLHSMPDALLMDVIQMARDSQRDISPAFVQMMNALRLVTRQGMEDTLSENPQAPMSPEQFDKLLDRERYEDYVSQDYGQQLAKLSSQVENGHGADFLGDIAKEYADSFAPAFIDCRVMTALSCLLGGVLAEDTSKVFNDCLKELAFKVARYGEWEVLAKALPFDGVQSVCRSDEFVQLLERAYLQDPMDKREELETIIMNSGEKNLPWILNHYLTTLDKKEEDRFLSLLRQFGSSAADRVLKDLKQLSILTLDKIIRLLQACHVRLSPEQMKMLLSSEDPKIHFRGIQLLMDQDPKKALKELQRILRDKKGSLRSLALDFISMNRYQQTVPLLLKSISVFYIDESRFLFNCDLFKALHALGPDALQMAASRVQGFKLSLTPKSLKETQQYLRGLLT